MDLIELNTDTRKEKGNGPARVLRRDGRIPAVLYGPKSEPIMLSVSVREIENILKKESSARVLLGLTVDGAKGKPKPVMIKELQRHPVTRSFLHVDFYEVDMARKIKVNVPIVTEGKCKGVELGGMLQIIRRELEVFCLPHEIPESVIIDITDLDVGESVHVQDIPLGENVEIPADVNFTILTVTSPKAEDEEGEEAEEGEEEVEAAEETTEES